MENISSLELDFQKVELDLARQKNWLLTLKFMEYLRHNSIAPSEIIKKISIEKTLSVHQRTGSFEGELSMFGEGILIFKVLGFRVGNGPSQVKILVENYPVSMYAESLTSRTLIDALLLWIARTLGEPYFGRPTDLTTVKIDGLVALITSNTSLLDDIQKSFNDVELYEPSFGEKIDPLALQTLVDGIDDKVIKEAIMCAASDVDVRNTLWIGYQINFCEVMRCQHLTVTTKTGCQYPTEICFARKPTECRAIYVEISSRTVVEIPCFTPEDAFTCLLEICAWQDETKVICAQIRTAAKIDIVVRTSWRFGFVLDGDTVYRSLII